MICDVPSCTSRAEEEVTVKAVRPDGTMTEVTRVLCVKHAGTWGTTPLAMRDEVEAIRRGKAG